jgi:hypothetical protein
MHDTVWFDLQGIPSVTVASSEFEDGADTQRRALGLPDAPFILVPHPIQDATDEEMRGKARDAFGMILAALTSAEDGPPAAD